MRIALLEDDPDQSLLLRSWLEDADYTVTEQHNGNDFLRCVRRDSFDLYLIDWLLPDVSGIDVLLKLRTELQDNTPVLIATVKKEERNIVQALEAGADDYLVKPVRRQELVARVNAVCRRTSRVQPEMESIDVDPYTVDLTHNQILLRGEHIPLTNREFELALFLFRSAGSVVSRSHLLDSIWGIDNANISTRTVDTHISRLRKKLMLGEENGWTLTAIYQHGYRLEKSSASV